MKFQAKTKAALVTSVLMPLMVTASHAQEGQWQPERNITYIVQAGVGGGSDIVARTLVQIIDELDLVPTNIVVENRAGGAGTIAYSYIAQQTGDPHYLGGVGVSFFTTPLLGSSPVNYTSFTPVAAFAYSPYILVVRDDSPIQSIPDIAERQGLTSGTAATVSDPTLLSRMLSNEIDTEIRVVPFDGGGEILAAVLGGHIDIFFASPGEIMEQLNAGTLRPLAVSSPERMELLPDVPTFEELGYAIDHVQLRGLIMPADIPPEALDYWQDTLRQVTASEQWQERYIDRFGEISIFLDSEEFAEQMERTSDMYTVMMQDLGLID